MAAPPMAPPSPDPTGAAPPSAEPHPADQPRGAPSAGAQPAAAPPTEVRRLFPLLCGFEVIPRTISTRDRGHRILHAVPITAYLLDTARGWVLFDTGLDEGHLHDPARRQALFLDRGWSPPPEVWEHHRLEPQLAALGLGFADIALVILSHLHADHSGHLKRLTHAPVLLQRAEYSHAFGTPGPAWFAEDYALPGIDWRLLDGDHAVMPGLTLLSTPGHTPGHQSALVHLPDSGPVLLAADVGDLMENFREEVLPGEASDDAAALASIRRLNALVAETGALMLLTHDPDLLLRTRLAPDFYA